jgi:predicted TIM-barrel fold metal-dependent hydrolase
MKVTDFHTHIFPDNLAQRAIDALKQHSPESMAYTDGTLAGLKKSMRQSGVFRSVLLPIATKPAQVRTINESCKALMSDDCVPFGTLHPESKDFEDEIALLSSFHVKGIKFHPEYQDFFIDNPRLFPMYDALQSSAMIVVFHAGKDPGPFTCDHALPPAIAAVHRNFPRLIMVAAHMGGWKIWDDVEKHLVGLPIYFDTAAVREFMAPEEFVRLAGKHGAHRILFGTDSPWFDQAEDIRWIDSMKLTQDEKDRIFFKNAEELLEG